MPTYEYECADCKRVFEIRQRISEPPLETCDKCGGAVRRLLAAAPFILKGGGWYVTDYPSESRKKAQKESSTGDASAPSSSGGDASKTSSNGGSTGGSTTSGGSEGAKPTPAKKAAKD